MHNKEKDIWYETANKLIKENDIDYFKGLINEEKFDNDDSVKEFIKSEYDWNKDNVDFEKRKGHFMWAMVFEHNMKMWTKIADEYDFDITSNIITKNNKTQRLTLNQIHLLFHELDIWNKIGIYDNTKKALFISKVSGRGVDNARQNLSNFDKKVNTETNSYVVNKLLKELGLK